jgi:hypothetical protein
VSRSRAASATDAGQDVVEDDDAPPRGVALHVHEVAQDELRQVHPVDEREGCRLALERASGIGPGENSSLVVRTRLTSVSSSPSR